MRVFWLLLLITCSAGAQTISYFNQGFLRQPDAATDRAYLGIFGGSGTNYVAGAGITMLLTGPTTYSISTAGGGGAFVLKAGDTMTGQLNLNNVSVSSAPTSVSGDGNVLTLGSSALNGTYARYMTFNVQKVLGEYDWYFRAPFTADQVMVLKHDSLSLNFGAYYGDGYGLTNITGTVGLSITQSLLLVSGGSTNLYTNVFANGLLIASGPSGAGHASSLILPGGGYLLQPNLGSILIP